MKQQIIDTFVKSTVHSNQIIKEVEEKIKTLSLDENYCLVLMDIVDDQTVPDQIRLASLIQLKINIDRRWGPVPLMNQMPLNQNTKTQIKQTLLTAMIRCQHIAPFIRIYKTIVSIIVGYQCRNWMPTQKIVQVLATQPENTNITIVFIQAAISAFTEKPNDNKKVLDQLLTAVVPLLYQYMTGERKSIPLIYLTVKTIENAFKIDLTPTLKSYVPYWMPLLKQIIEHKEPSLSIHNVGNKSSLDSCFYRAKKWAMKIINKFFQTHTSSMEKKNESFAKEWLQKYSQGFVETFVQQITQPNLPKTLFFMMKSLAFACSRVPRFVMPYSQYLLKTIIPPYVRLVPEDQNKANSDPLELLKSEEDVIGIDGKPKSAAINLWTILVDLGSSVTSKIEGPNIKKSLEWIYQQLSSETDLLAKESAMMLLCRAKYPYSKHSWTKQPIIQIIEKQVLPLLQSDVMLIRARAIEIFDYYGDLNYSETYIKRIVECLYKALSEKDKIILNIKAACAFNCILRHKSVLEMVKPYLQNLLQTYIKLISQHEIQNLVASLEGIVEIYGEDIEPFAVDLLVYLSSQFVTFSDGNNNNINTGNDVSEEFELAASACLDVMKKIVDCSFNQNILVSIEPSILKVVEESFTEEGCQYYQGALELLSIYIYRCQTISDKLWFFYPCILYQILGLPEEYRDKEIPIANPNQTRILNKMDSYYSKENLEVSMNVIRNYIYKSSIMALQQKDMFGVQRLQTILKIFEHAYHIENREPQEVLNSAVLFINIFENTKCIPSMITIAWQIIRHTLVFVKSITGRKVAYQMFCLCLLVNPPVILHLLETQAANGVDMFKHIIQVEDAWRKQYEVTRVILGFSSLFLIERKEDLNAIMPDIFKFLVRMINKLATIRLRTEKQIEEEDDEDQDFEETDCWMEGKDKIRTHMDKVDAAVFFETSFKHLGEKEPTVFAELRTLLTPQDEGKLDQSLSKAKQRFISRHIAPKKMTETL